MRDSTTHEKDAVEARLEAVGEAMKAAFARDSWQRPTSPRTNTYASGWRECDRWAALDLTDPWDEDEPTVERVAAMRRGEEREAALCARLTGIGPFCDPPFSVSGGQERFVVRGRNGKPVITGKVDGRLDFGDGLRPVFEVKSGRMTTDVRTLDDFDRNPWTRRMPYQLLAYLLGANERYGVLICDTFNLPTLVLVDLFEHMDKAEQFLAQAERAWQVRHNGAELPEFSQSAAVCGRCPHNGRSCVPPAASSVSIITDEEILAALARRAELHEAAKEHEALDKEVKKALRGVEHAIAGDFELKGAWRKKTTVSMPKEVRDRYAIVDPKGTFVLKIERITSELTEDAGRGATPHRAGVR